MSKKTESELEGLHYEILQDWIDKGRTEALPPEMEEYVNQLDHVRGLWNSNHTQSQIIKHLMSRYQLNRLTAKSRFEDAMCYFFMDKKIKQDTWRNIIFEKQMQIVNAAIASAKTVDDYNKASIILQRAYKAKGLDREEEKEIPEEFFIKPIKVFSLDTSNFADLPKPNRNLLGQYIDEMNIAEEEKIRIKQEMGAEPKELFEYESKKND